MTADQKLHRALTSLIYEYFEDSYKEYTSEAYDGEHEDHLLSCIHKAELIARRYSNNKLKEKV